MKNRNKTTNPPTPPPPHPNSSIKQNTTHAKPPFLDMDSIAYAMGFTN